MAEVRWTPQAADDLEAITDFIAQDSPHYASLFALDAVKAAERLPANGVGNRNTLSMQCPFLRAPPLGKARSRAVGILWPSSNDLQTRVVVNRSNASYNDKAA